MHSDNKLQQITLNYINLNKYIFCQYNNVHHFISEVLLAKTTLSLETIERKAKSWLSARKQCIERRLAKNT